MSIGRASAGPCIALLLTACATGGESIVPSAEVSMAGRWILATPNAPTCGLNFSGAPGVSEGRVSPEGGCPGRFFMSRRWIMVQGGLTIFDEEGQPVATLSYANGHFAGQAATGMAVTLTPPAAPPPE